MLEEKAITIDSQEIKYLKRQTGGPMVLFLPGISGTDKEWARVIDKLPNRFSVISMSLPPYNKDNSLVSLPKIVKKFINEMNIGSVVLIGHSLGGLVALRVASLFPGIISKVAIIASPLPDIEKRRLVKSVIPRLSDIKNINQLSRYYGSHKNLIDNLARFLDYGQNGEKKMDEEEWNKLVYCIIDIVSHPWIKDIEKIICPTLVVYGEKDLALLYFGGTDLYPEFKNAIVLKIDGDHRLPRNKPSELALIIKGFVYEEGDLG